MHILQSKHIKLKQEEVKALLTKYNISIAQLPKIKAGDPSLSNDCIRGDIVKIERKFDDKVKTYYRVVV
mgnify:CR=1 FL=1